MVHRNTFISRRERGEIALGGWIDNRDFDAARRAGDSSMDFIVVDMEHHNFDLPRLPDTLQWMLSRRRAMDGGAPVAPLVRIPDSDPHSMRWVVKQVLDAGAMGVVVPECKYPEDVSEFVSLMRYPQGIDGTGPTGKRGLSPLLAARYWGCGSAVEYMRSADLWPHNPAGELLLVILVEHIEAWDRIDDLVSVPGVGAVLWGAGDGALSLQGPAGFALDAPELEMYERQVVEACKRANVPVGAPLVADVDLALAKGYDFLIPSRWSAREADRIRNLHSSGAAGDLPAT